MSLPLRLPWLSLRHYPRTSPLPFLFLRSPFAFYHVRAPHREQLFAPPPSMGSACCSVRLLAHRPGILSPPSIFRPPSPDLRVDYKFGKPPPYFSHLLGVPSSNSSVVRLPTFTLPPVDHQSSAVPFLHPTRRLRCFFFFLFSSFPPKDALYSPCQFRSSSRPPLPFLPTCFLPFLPLSSRFPPAICLRANSFRFREISRSAAIGRLPLFSLP